jgi:hypothetical protein
MSTRRFLPTLVLCVAASAGLLVLAAVLDAPALAAVAMVLVVACFVARDAWRWRGAGRQYLAVTLLLVAVVALAFLAQRAL